MIWLGVLRAARVAADVFAGVASLVQRVKGYPRSLLPPSTDDDEEPIPLTYRDVEHQRRQAQSGARAFPTPVLLPPPSLTPVPTPLPPTQPSRRLPPPPKMPVVPKRPTPSRRSRR